MARQRKTLPARRRDAMDDSLLIRSAESLGRVIGSLQRQLDAARHVVSTQQGRAKAPAVARSASARPRQSLGGGGNTTRGDGRGNGQAPARERNVKMNSKAKTRTAVDRKAPRLAARTPGPAARKQSSTKRRSPKTR